MSAQHRAEGGLVNDGAPLRTDRIAGRFQPIAPLGAGGMGVVQEVIDVATGTHLALKSLRHALPARLLAFKNEFRALQDVHHPNLVGLHELFEENGQFYLTMDLVRGVDIVSWVCPPPDKRCNEARMRDALAQLVRGLTALHDAHKVHRDIKPSNVLVTDKGRVVVLDFGLVTGVDALSDLSSEYATAAYVAPEHPRGIAGDFYSVGVLLFLLLTGELPFTGSPQAVLDAKISVDAPAPSEFAPDVPKELDALCIQLLLRDPEARPSGAEILDSLSTAAHRGSQRPPRRAEVPFVGRTEQLATLDALSDTVTATSEPRMAVVEGASGVGKSAILRQFVERLVAETPGALVLGGRCYEREIMSFKAFDGVIDALAMHLTELETADITDIAPYDAPLLARAFPVLSGFGPFIEPFGLGALRNAQEQRARVFGAVRELFTQLAKKVRKVVVTIDDLQWADADSLALLGELLRPPKAPPILLVGTRRRKSPSDELPMSSDRGELAHLPEVTALQLDALAPGEAAEFVNALLSAHELPAQYSEELAREGAGHPLLLEVLARHTALRGSVEQVSIRSAFWAHIESLSAPARSLVTLLSVADQPLGATLARLAVGLPAEAFTAALAEARGASLLRLEGAPGQERIEPSHDSIRDAVLLHVGPEEQRRTHRAIAEIAGELGAAVTPELLATHWEGAGEVALASEWAIQAAERAAEALAFDHAAGLFGRALRLGVAATEQPRIYAALGDALANAGRGAEAAEAYGKAAEGSPKEASLALRHREAEQLLLSGHFDRGQAAINGVLRAVGLAEARPPPMAFLFFLLLAAWLRIRGVGFTEREPSEVKTAARLRLDVLWSAIRGTVLSSTLSAFELQRRFVLLALSSGCRQDVALALSAEATLLANTGMRGYRRALPLFSRARELSAHVASHHVAAVLSIHQSAAEFAAGDLRRANQFARAAETELVQHCSGVAWDLTTARGYVCWTLYYMGEFGTLEQLAGRYAADAQRRRDLHALMHFTLGLPYVIHLIGDDAERGRALIDETIRRWPATSFTLQHYYALLAHVLTDLYVGDYRGAWERLARSTGALSRSFLDRVTTVRMEAEQLRATAALGLARSLGPRSTEGKALLRAASRSARALEAEKQPVATALAGITRVGLLALDPETRGARSEFEEVARQLDDCGMKLHAAAVRARGGEINGGLRGECDVTAAERAFSRQSVRNPRAMRRMLVP